MSSRPDFSRVGQFTYDLGRWPAKVYLDPTIDDITGTPFTLASTTEITKVSHQFDSTTRFLIDDFPRFMSNETNLTLINEGDSTDYNRDLVYYTPMDAIVDRISFNLGLGFQVSAYTNGNFRINRLLLEFSSFKASGQLSYKTNVAKTISMTNMTGIDNQIAVFNEIYSDPIPLYAGGALNININIDTAEGTGTYQKGIMSAFPLQATGGLRKYYESAIIMYLRPMARKGANTMTPADYAAESGT